MIEEKIKAEITCHEALNQLSPQAIVEYLSTEYKGKHKELLSAFHDDELMEQLGGIDTILDNNETAVREHFDNMNASNEEG